MDKLDRGMIDIPGMGEGQQGRIVGDFIMLFRMVCNLKFKNWVKVASSSILFCAIILV